MAGVAAFHRGVLFDPEIVIPWDLRAYHLPLAKVHADALKRGELPLWDPSTYCGRPVAANIQAQVFYPPRAATAWLARHAGIAGLRRALELELITHVALAGVLAFLLARRLGLTATPALLAGFAYSLGCYFASQAQHLGAVEGAAWIPLVWLAVLRNSFALLAASASAAVLCGFTPLTVATFLSALLIAALFRRRWLLQAAAGLAATALLCAVQLFPAIELYHNSVAKFRGEWAGTGGGLPLASLVSLVWPNYYNLFDFARYSAPYEYTLMYVYCGWFVLVLAVAGARTLSRMAAVAAAAALLMLGDSTPFGVALSAAWPDWLRGAIYPHHWLAPFSLAVSLLAANGLARIRGPRTAAAIAALAAVDLIAVGSGRPFNSQSLRDEPGVTEAALDGDTEALRTVRALVAAASPPWRIDTIDDSIAWMMSAPLHGIPAANGYDPFALERYIQARLQLARGERWGAYYQVERPDSPALDSFSVRYLLSRKPVPGRAPVAVAPGRFIYENPDAHPRFRVAGGVAGGVVDVISYEPHRVTLRVRSATGGELVTSEAHYPGWRAYVSGRETPIRHVNIAFRGLTVPPGDHTVEMRFEAPWIVRGAAVSAISWAILLLSMAFSKRM